MAEAGLGVSPAGAKAPPGAQKGAVKRLLHDLQGLHRSPNPMLEVRPLPSNMLEWHFVLHDLPADTPYSGACYHGQLVFPSSYPLAPPSIYMLTPNGRLNVNQKLCLSMTDYHPESWNPAWSTETILVGFLSFFTSDREQGFGSISKSREEREQLAHASWVFNSANATFAKIFPEFLEPPPPPPVASSSQRTTGPMGAVPLPRLVPAAADAALTVAARDASVAASGTVVLADFADEAAVEGDGGADEGNSVELAEVPHIVPLLPAVAGGDDELERETPECWICRDTTSTETLIQPCACRGSMSFVHASCVETWIRHQRQNWQNGDPPRCSVCQQEYHGSEESPGFWVFVLQACCHFIKSMFWGMYYLFRVLVSLGLGTLAACGHPACPQWARVPAIVMVGAVWLRKMLILTVSLPRVFQANGAPANRFAALFFLEDPAEISYHIFCVPMAIVMWPFLWATGVLPLPYFLFVVLCALVPLIGNLSRKCLTLASKLFLFILFSPLLALLFLVGFFPYMIYLLLKEAPEALHPLGPIWHIVVVLVSLPVGVACQSNLPLLILLGSHTAVMLCGLFERLFIRRLAWVDHPLWVSNTMLPFMLLRFFNCAKYTEGWGASDRDRKNKAYLWCFLWILVLWVFSASVHWQHFVSVYRRWQQQNGRFILDTGPSADDGGGAAGGVADGDDGLAVAGEAV